MGNISTNIMMNMYTQGSLVKNDNEIARYLTANNEYVIELSRRPVEKIMWGDNNSYRYICTIAFKDLLGREILELNMTEVDILIMIDNIEEFLADQMMDEWLCDKIKSNDIFKLYKLHLNRPYNNHYISNPDYFISIFEFDKHTNIESLKISVYFNDNSLLDFIDIVYFTFLADIDEGSLIENNFFG